jgi:proteasome accessory factor A
MGYTKGTALSRGTEAVMTIPKIVGIETEYAIVIENMTDFNHLDACNRLLDRFNSSVSIKEDIQCTPVYPGKNKRKSKRDLMLSNGARFYIDLGHPEYATPECLDPLDLVACDKAGEFILDQCVRRINYQLPLGQRMRLFKNNSDHQGHTYGCHENYLIFAPVFEKLVKEKKDELAKHLIPFLVTRQIYTGAGKVGSECGTRGIKFQVSQRADFFKTQIGTQTTYKRPIINTRDEPHADPTRFRRLHIITGDANMSELSTYLKIGVTQVVLQMIEQGLIKKDLTLAHPVKAMKRISRDASLTQLTAKVALKNGKKMTALEIQQQFLDAARTYLSRKMSHPAPPFMTTVVDKWEDVLNRLEQNPRSLSKKIDWIIKMFFIERWMKRQGLTGNDFNDPRIVEIDTNYHDINREKGIFYLLQKHRLVDRLFSSHKEIKSFDKKIKSFITGPPKNSRAWVRGRYIKEHPGEIKSADWEKILLAKSMISLPDPANPV